MEENQEAVDLSSKSSTVISLDKESMDCSTSIDEDSTKTSVDEESDKTSVEKDSTVTSYGTESIATSDGAEFTITSDDKASTSSDDKDVPSNLENVHIADSDEHEIKTEIKPEGFKRPQLIIGPRKGGFPIKSIKKIEEPAPVKKSSNPALQIYSDPNVKKEKSIPPLPYHEPHWGGEIPQDEFKFEVLKNGVIIETIRLDTKSFYIFGRLSSCDIQMNHPSSSRYHAVLQYRPTATGSENNEQRGFYVYDLGSTHGTFLNKQKLKPKVYAPVKVGHVISIGGSSRMMILQGPEELSEPESELTLTQLKEQRRQKEMQKKLDEEKRKMDEIEEEEKRKKKEEEAGIDWGMGDDADEETDLSENPFASTTNEELFLTDPKKSLRGWFEREGHELDYDVTERASGQFLCRVTLPVDDAQGRPLVAEALVRGKKKEAVVQCAMEACRILDRQGLFRQAKHESRGQRRKRDWEEDDYYDSDDDNYLDRTGSVEAKRLRRMEAEGKLESKAETYESLLAKLEQLRTEITEAESQVESSSTSVASGVAEGGDEDALDAFMNTLKQQAAKKTSDKITQRAAKARVEKLRQEELRLLHLANIARPASLPPLISAPSAGGGQTKKLGALTGARPSSKLKPKISSIPVASSSTVSEEAGEVEEESEDDEPSEELSDSVKIQSEPLPAKTEPQTIKSPVKNVEPKVESNEPSSSEKVSVKSQSLGPSIPPEMLRQLRGAEDGEEPTSKPQRTRTRHRQANKKGGPSLALENDEDYSSWVPPSGQTGDGRTNLNAKFGY